MNHPLRLSRLFLLFLLLTLLPTCCIAQKRDQESEPDFEAYSRIINVPSVGSLHYYAQNDPAWADAFYEYRGSKTWRRFQSTGCGPTTLAMAVARQLPEEALPRLLAYAMHPERGFPFCPCSVIADPAKCSHEHEATLPTTAEDFSAFLPVILASYATGNNIHYQTLRTEEPGTHLSLFQLVAEDYGLVYNATRRWETALEALRSGASVITSVVRGPFTPTSHYLFLAGADDTMLYILDSDMRSEYTMDKLGKLTLLEPGLVCVPLDELEGIRLYSFYIISQATQELPN